MGLSCVETCSEWACKTDTLVGTSDQAYLSAPSWSLVWAAAVRSPAEIIGKQTAITDTSGWRAVYEQCRNDEGKELTSSSYRTPWFYCLRWQRLQFPRILRDSYCGITELKTTTTGNLLTWNGRTIPRQCICIWFIHKFTYRCAEPNSCDYIM
jgi:hypothetical protein